MLKTMKTTDFGTVIRKKLADNPELAAMVEDAAVDAHTAREIYRARNAARLTQKQLADLAGTYQSVIARIEDADYGSHSMRVLKKIAAALGKRLRVELYDKPAFDPIPTGNDGSDVAWSLSWDASNVPSTSSTCGFKKFNPITMQP
jgi:transcriptional regulator with XRE-family HTH domain